MTLAIYITIAFTQLAIMIHEFHAFIITRRQRLRKDNTSLTILVLSVIMTILVTVLYTLALYSGPPAKLTTSQAII